MKIKKGDKLKCVAARDLQELTLDKEYVALRDEEKGIFANRPYVTVNGNEGPATCHASRFEIL